MKRKTRLPVPLLTIADLVFDMLAPGPGREPPKFGASFSVPFFTNKPIDRRSPTITQFSPVNNGARLIQRLPRSRNSRAVRPTTGSLGRSHVPGISTTDVTVREKLLEGTRITGKGRILKIISLTGSFTEGEVGSTKPTVP